MSKNILKIVSDAHDALGIEYGFGEYSGNPKTGKIVYPYSVGEYSETEQLFEDGMQETNFILNLFHRGDWLGLETAKEKIEKYFNKVGGKKVMAADGSVAVVFYANALIVPTGDAELKRIQINLHCKEWRVD